MKLHFITSNSRFLQLKRMTLAIPRRRYFGNYISSAIIHKLRSSLIARDRGHFQGLPDLEEKKKKIPSRSPYPERFCSPLAITSFRLPFHSFLLPRRTNRIAGSIHALHAPVLPLDRSSAGFLLDVVTKRFGLNVLHCLLAFRPGKRK